MGGKYSNQCYAVRFGDELIGYFGDLDEVRWAIEGDMRSHWGDVRRSAFGYSTTVEERPK